ncbi:sulfatase [Lentisphaera profundi]|uniref:Sulfatase n=1 Tax=Lentisphaera profundi TaxID=1658616 RepID=A0ABY7VTS3_9BACT|nr:sulfatase [Lentisphaera profundi]WDE97611.1 sulfatase [Lentisphaera profundi]
MKLKFIPFLLLSFSLFSQDRPKPNIVLMLADDLGWQDVKCYDIDKPSPMETPNLDALATKGVKFWQAYSPAPVCAPSRAAILSGHHPARGEMTSVAGGKPPHAGHPKNSFQITPWYSSRMPLSTFSLAEALKAEGYTTGHSGKWHISKNHYAYPQPFHHGFDYSVHERGVQNNMTPDRLTEFATNDPKDPYRLDKNGMPFDAPQHGAMTFIKENQDKPFFLYYATWLVHAPIVMRSEALLRKYEKKLGVTLTDEHKKSWKKKGQSNPFYCAMVEQLDYYLGQIFTHLETTDDPRWPGHKLIENTYIIFSSDNGGMEGGGNEIYTDNFPLDRGKISTKEGGVRVPLIITGPGIAKNTESEVMVNGLDFFPTILSLIGAKKPKNKIFDGCDLVPLLKTDVSDPTLVKNTAGKVRDTMLWHFPQSENTSSIRVGDYKLLRRYNKENSLELYRLYDSSKQTQVRSDIEEMKDIAVKMPDKVRELNDKLSLIISGMGGRTPYFNPHYVGPLTHKKKAPVIFNHKQVGNKVEFRFKNNGAQVIHADLIYTQKGGDRDEEWQRLDAEILEDNKVIAFLPKHTSHFFLNLIDENNFLASYPEIDGLKKRNENLGFSSMALKAHYPKAHKGKPINFSEIFTDLSQPNSHVDILLSEDFEADKLPTSMSFTQGISLSNIAAASGSQGLELFDSKKLTRPWMPLTDFKVDTPKDKKSGQLRISFALKLDEKSPGILGFVLRDHRSGKRLSLGDIKIGDDCVKANGLTLMSFDPGICYQVDLSLQWGPKRSHFYTLSATTADGRHLSASVPYENYHFNLPDSVSLMGLGAQESLIYIDNLVIRLED